MQIEQTISKPQMAILKSPASLNLFLAGVGSGKTYIGGLLAYRFVKRYPKARGFIGANTYLQLTQSTLFRIREYWKSIGVREYEKTSCPYGHYVVNKKPPPHFDTSGHNFDDYYGIISFMNGCVIFTGSLDHCEAHYGKEFSWAILDETKDSDEIDVKEVILSRLRQKGIYIKNGKLSDEGQDFNPAYFLTSPAKTEWINELFDLEKYTEEISQKIYSKTDYFEKLVGDKFVTISSTYHNIKNLPLNYIDLIKERNTEERFKAIVYGNPFAVTGGEFYSSFNRLSQVTRLTYDPDLAIHISFDQNVVPYNSASIWQVRRNGDLWDWMCIDEIALTNPHNSTEEVCDEFIKRYPSPQTGLYFYGDASGRNRSTMNKDFKNHYDIIAFKLARYLNNHSDRTLFANPPVIKRRDFINRICENKTPIRMYINESCKHMIADLMYTKQALDGGKDKHIVSDPDTGEKYQKYGHMGDNLEYMAVELFKNYYL